VYSFSITVLKTYRIIISDLELMKYYFTDSFNNFISKSINIYLYYIGIGESHN
jgi:hypothetical protein